MIEAALKRLDVIPLQVLIERVSSTSRLCSATTDNTARQELIVLLTPRAVRDQAEARGVTKEFRHRLRQLESEIPGG